MTVTRPRHILEPATVSAWTCVEAIDAFDAGAFLVRRDRVLKPDGLPGNYTFVEAPSDFCVVVALDGAGRVTLVRQWRYPWGESSWELPAGHLEPGESGLAAAQRELQEEAGLIAASWQPLALLHNSASLTAHSHLFLARDLSAAPTAREGSEDDMLVRRLPLAAALAAAANGDIVHAVTISALFLAQRAVEAG
jgi:8-oxo-dGTP pyrophosphatase MutT (NUDIX family)